MEIIVSPDGFAPPMPVLQTGALLLGYEDGGGGSGGI